MGGLKMIETIEEGLAIWLKEHGVKQDATLSFDNKVSAFTLDEILKLLLPTIKTEYAYYFLNVRKGEDSLYGVYYGVYYGLSDDCFALVQFWDKNPAQAAGLLLKWCIENGHVKP
jgi:hypothetical protein